MKALYIAWQDPQTRLWHTVGQLSRENDLYRFAYTQGALVSPRFKYLGRMGIYIKITIRMSYFRCLPTVS